MLTAITRKVSPSLAACELEFLAREPIDLAKAIAQHEGYECFGQTHTLPKRSVDTFHTAFILRKRGLSGASRSWPSARFCCR